RGRCDGSGRHGAACVRSKAAFAAAKAAFDHVILGHVILSPTQTMRFMPGCALHLRWAKDLTIATFWQDRTQITNNPITNSQTDRCETPLPSPQATGSD